MEKYGLKTSMCLPKIKKCLFCNKEAAVNCYITRRWIRSDRMLF